LLVLVSGCVTPVIPLPPPLQPTIIVDPAKGEVVFEGPLSAPHQDALFYIFNSKNGKGVIIQAAHDGSYVADPLPAADGDEVNLWASRWGSDSPSSVLCLMVRYTSATDGKLVDCP